MSSLFLYLLIGTLFATLFKRRERKTDLSRVTDAEDDFRKQVISSELSYSKLANGMDSIVLECDPHGVILYANSVAAREFNNPALIGKTVSSVAQTEALSEIVVGALQAQEAIKAEVSLSHPNESVYAVRAWQPDVANQTVLMTLRNITDLKHFERVRRDFVANVSHELRTPMATIRAMSETLQDDGGDAELREKYLGRIIKEVDRLTNITDDLLLLSAVESSEPTRSRVDLSELVRSVVAQLTSKAQDKKLEIALDCKPDVFVQGSEEHLTQLVVNLVDNAIKYTQEGSVTVELSQEDEHARLIVVDTGIGIPGEHLSRIFERFYRVDKGRSRATGGTGLGLSIVRNIVETHHGKLSVASELGEGTRFTVLLPTD